MFEDDVQYIHISCEILFKNVRSFSNDYYEKNVLDADTWFNADTWFYFSPLDILNYG